MNPLLNAMYSAIGFKIILASIKLGIYDITYKPIIIENASKKLNVNLRNIELLFDSLVSLGLLGKQGNYYCNTVLAKKYLTSNSPDYIGGLLVMSYEGTGIETVNLLELVNKGPAISEINSDAYAEVSNKDINIMLRGQSGGYANQICQIVKKLNKENTIEKILDLGGGPGVICAEILKTNIHMTGTVFELPYMKNYIENIIKIYRLANRMTYIYGDFTKDSVGTGYDLVIAIGCLNFAKNDLKNILQKIYHSLNKGGRLVCISEGIDWTEVSPACMVISWLPYRLAGVDIVMHSEELLQPIRLYFKNVYVEKSELYIGPMEVIVAYK